MKPSELSLFTAAEQKLLVDTENARLEHLNEDDLAALLTRVRRSRNKYSDLHRRQGAGAVRDAGKRYAAKTSNQRTLRKAEIFDDAVSRVARYLSRTARANANAVKQQRLEAARSGTTPKTAQRRAPSTGPKTGASRGKGAPDPIAPARKGSTSARGRRSQGKKDARA